MSLLRRRRPEDDFHDEIRAHIDLEADRLIADGMDPAEARAAAHRAFGNVTHSRETYYESSRWMWLDHAVRDVRAAVRGMKRSPVSAATIILSLALGIGASTAIFSLADQALLRPLPVAAPDRLVQLRWSGRFIGGGLGFGDMMPHPFFRALRGEQDVFVDVFARSQAEAIVSSGSDAEAVTVEVVSGSYFPTLGVRPVVGRLFTDADDLHEDGHPIVVLSHDYWTNRFGADSNVVGRRVRVNDHPMTVIGVAQPEFRGTDWSRVSAIWVPMMMNGRIIGRSRLTERRERFLHVYARLPEGAMRSRAEAALQPWFTNYLRADTEREGWPAVTEQQFNEYLASRLELLPGERGQAALGSEIRAPMLILLAATGLCLLLACLNVANVQLARTLARRQTIALRTALGASRRRIVMGQLVEGAVLAGAGGMAGAVLAPQISRAILSHLLPGGATGSALQAGLDLRVLGVGMAITAVATLLSGAAPAFHAAAVRPVTLVRQSSGMATGLESRKVLVVAQFALALVLLVGAGLFARTLGSLRAQGPGFSTANLLMFSLAPQRAGYGLAEAKHVLRSVLTELRAAPGVEGAGLGAYEMLRRGSWNNPVTVESPERFVIPESLPMNAVTPGFFAALGAPILAGRDFHAGDRRDEPGWGLRSAIVNEEFRRRYLAGINPIGVRLGIGSRPDVETTIEIVGVVSTFHTRGLRSAEPHVFFPLWERTAGEGTFYVRARGSSAAAVGAIRAAVTRIDPKLSVLSLRTMEDQFDRMLVAERTLAAAAGAFATVATLLAMIGLYGLLSFNAARRAKEIGIRLALGAQRRTASGLIVREAAILAIVGAVIAFPLVWAMGRLVESQLFGVRPLDAVTLAGAIVVLTVVCLAASAIPARRAASVDPIEVLRRE